MIAKIDCHCHIYPAKIAEKAVAGIGGFYGIEMSHDGRFSTLLKENKANGIVHSLIFSVATKPSQTQSINAFISDNCKQHPEMFTGLGTLHPFSTDIKGDIEHILELGLKGVKLHHDMIGVAIDDKSCYKIYELCQEFCLPLLLHTGDKRYNYSNPKNLISILKDFPSLTVIGAHFAGYSVWDEVMDNLGGYSNLYVDCSSSMAFLSKEKGRELVRFFGADKVIFGTDFPMWSVSEEINRLESLGLTEQEKEKIYHKNACKLFNIKI